eukprot:403331302
MATYQNILNSNNSAKNNQAAKSGKYLMNSYQQSEYSNMDSFQNHDLGREELIILTHMNQVPFNQKPGLFTHHQRTSTASSASSSSDSLTHPHSFAKHQFSQNLSQSQVQQQIFENSQKLAGKLSVLQKSYNQTTQMQTQQPSQLTSQLISSNASNCSTQQNTHRGERTDKVN